MLVRSIPLYRETLDLVARMAGSYLRSGDTVLDLGVSHGNASLAIQAAYPDRSLRFIGVDNSRSMLEIAKGKLPGAELIEHDLRQGLPYRAQAAKPRVVLSMWTAQFIPIEFRQQYFAGIHEAIAPNGALFVSEKLLGQTAHFQKQIVKHYHEWKMRSGYSWEDVYDKSKALQGVLVSYDAPGLKNLVTRAGFEIEEITRYLGFASWICYPKGSR